MESLEFGGLIGGGGPSRVPQIRWTQPLAQYGLLGALSLSAESPETDIWAPTGGGAQGTGVFGANASTSVTLQTPTVAGSGALGAAACGTSLANFTGTTTNVVTGIGPGGLTTTPITTAAGSCPTTPGNPLKNTAPELVAAWYIPQPWGHVNFATVVRPLLRVQTTYGAGVDRTYIGYGFAFSGDVKPRWFGWDRDYFAWNFHTGEAMGRYHYAGAGSSVSLVSNLSGNALANNSVLIKPTRGFAGNVHYQHRWSPEWRSNIGVGYWRLDIPGLNGAVCPGGSRATAGDGCGLNKELMMGKANLIWQPVSFVDIGLEYNYGRRKVVSDQHGDEHVVVNRLRLRF